MHIAIRILEQKLSTEQKVLASMMATNASAYDENAVRFQNLTPEMKAKAMSSAQDSAQWYEANAILETEAKIKDLEQALNILREGLPEGFEELAAADCAHFKCVRCGQDFRFPINATLKVIKAARDNHKCQPTAFLKGAA